VLARSRKSAHLGESSEELASEKIFEAWQISRQHAKKNFDALYGLLHPLHKRQSIHME